MRPLDSARPALVVRQPPADYRTGDSGASVHHPDSHLATSAPASSDLSPSSLPPAALLHALRQSFSPALSEAILRELSQGRPPNAPWGIADIERALRLGSNGPTTFAGVDTMSQLSHSAVMGGAEFRRIAQRLGLDPSQLDAATRQRIDLAIHNKFEQASLKGESPVPPAKAQQWLQVELSALTR